MVDYVLNSVVVVVDIELPEAAFVDKIVVENCIVGVRMAGGSLAFLILDDFAGGANIDSFGSQTDGGHNLGIHVEVYVFDVVVCHCVVHPPFLQMKIEISADHGFGEVVP